MYTVNARSFLAMGEPFTKLGYVRMHMRTIGP